jgi:hypothetical protein
MSRPEQVIIFRLTTRHNRLMHNRHRKLNLVPLPKCSCGDAEQTTEHIFQGCRNRQSLRDETWPEPTIAHEKLYGPAEELKRTTTFIASAALQV